MSKFIEHPPEGFEDLWTLWKPHMRKTDGRGKARPVYRKWLLEGAEPADILDGARYHLRTMKDRDREFIQMLSVYLNSERWVDECEMERAYQRRQAEKAEQGSNVTTLRPKPPPTAFLKTYQPKQGEGA